MNKKNVIMLIVFLSMHGWGASSALLGVTPLTEKRLQLKSCGGASVHNGRDLESGIMKSDENAIPLSRNIKPHHVMCGALSVTLTIMGLYVYNALTALPR